MEVNYTRQISFKELQNCSPDLFSDAFGLEAIFDQLISGIQDHNCSPDDRVISDLFIKIRRDAKVH